MTSRQTAACVMGVVTACFTLFAKPQPGDIFREYTWFNNTGAATGLKYCLRVGGSAGYGGGNISLPHNFDLTDASKAEVVIEKWECHATTKGLSISVNDNDWILMPEGDSIPDPPEAYQHQINTTAEVPLDQLTAGTGNHFKLEVGPDQSWGWPQNLIYGVHFRIYYNSSKSHPTGEVTSPESGSAIGESVEITADASSSGGSVKRVEFIGYYEDVNYEGDGVYRQWHFDYQNGELQHHVGTAEAAPYATTWNTSWVPEQTASMKIAARIMDQTGLIYMTEPIDNLALERADLSVELCRPYNIPTEWVTRKGALSESFDIAGDLTKKKAAQMVMSTWRAGEWSSGWSINGTDQAKPSGLTWECDFSRWPVTSIDALHAGTNSLTVNGGGEHGCEVNYPGVMVLIQYEGGGFEPVGATLGSRAVSHEAPLADVDYANGALSIGVRAPNRHSVQVLRANGQVAFSKSGSGRQGYCVSKPAVRSGVYVVRVRCDGATFVQRTVVY